MIPLCEHLLVSDPEPQVRGLTTNIISRAFSGTFDKERSRTLARVALDDTQSVVTRNAAIRGIININGEESSDTWEFLKCSDSRESRDKYRYTLISDIDWVKQYL